MGEFFHGGRRKAGFVTLALALVMDGMWARSHVFADRLCFGLQDTVHVILSTSDHLRWYSWDWRLDVTWSLQTGVRYDELRVTQMHRMLGTYGQLRGTFPYWWFALPLTLTSAFLILWPQRKRQTPA